MMTDAEFKTLIARLERDIARTRIAGALLAAFLLGFIAAGLAFNGVI